MDFWQNPPDGVGHGFEQLHGEEAVEEYKHGEIYFEETGVVTKFLVVPDHVKEPMDVLKVMLSPTGWNLPPPNITVSVSSAPGNYFALPAGWDKWPEAWGNTEEKAQENFSGRIGDMMYGIASAAVECKGWIISKRSYRNGGATTGSLFDEGVAKFKSARPNQAEFLINIGLHERDLLKDFFPKNINDFAEEDLPAGFDKNVARRLFGVNLDNTVAVPLSQKLEKRIVYRKLPAGPFEENKELDIRLVRASPPEFDQTANFLAWQLRPHLTHLVVTPSEEFSASLKKAIEALVPHVCVIASGKKTAFQQAMDMALRGSTVILLKESGFWVDFIVRSLEKNSPNMNQKNGEEAVKNIPSSVQQSQFLIFNALTDTPELVIEKLTRAMSNSGGEDIMEMGFAQNELERLREAWRHMVIFKISAERQKVSARLWQYLVILISFITTLCSVTLSASNLSKDEATEEHHEDISETFQVSERIDLSHSMKLYLGLTCAVLPLVLTFVVSFSQRIGPTKRWLMLMAAADRVQSEIYRYRTRVGEYAMSSANSKLSMLMQKPEESSKKSSRQFDDEAPELPRLAPREALSQNLTQIHTELATGEIRMGSLAQPTKAMKEKVFEACLYPHFMKKRSWYALFCCCCSRANNNYMDSPLLEEGQQRAGFSLLSTALEVDETNVEDDGVGLLSAEDYLCFRVMPAIKRLESQVPGMETIFNLYQFVVLFSTGAAGVFGILGLRTWIPAVVGFVAAVESMQQFEQSGTRLSAANHTLTELKNLLHWWQGLAMVGRRMKHNKHHLVEACEDALEAELTTVTQAVMRRKRVQRAGSEDNEKKEK